MIDGITLSFNSKTIEECLKAKGVKMIIHSNRDTGEVMKVTADFNNFKIKICPNGTVILNGSLHKYWKGENYSDFSHSDLVECIKKLSSDLEFNPKKARVQNIEFGVNINPLFNAYDFCQSVLTYKNKSFNTFQNNEIQIGFVCKRLQYSVKVYDKGRLEYTKNENILRFEIKTHKMCFVKNAGIKTLSDVTNKDCLAVLGEIMNKIYADLIIFDQVNQCKLTIKEKEIFNVYSNPRKWEKVNRSHRCRKKKHFNAIIEKHGLNQWKGKVAQMINDKWNMLYNT